MSKCCGWSAVCVLLIQAVVIAQGAPVTQVATRKDEAHPAAAGHRGPACVAVDPFFAAEVWGKVGATTCLKCHRAGGDAEDSRLVLQEASGKADRQTKALAGNRAAFLQMATLREGGSSRLLVKATGGLEHGGGQVLKADSTAFQILARFVRRANGAATKPHAPALGEVDHRPFFEGLSMVSPTRLLRRVTLSLAGRLPTTTERSAVQADGQQALDGILDAVMREDAFYERLQEAFNDIFLTRGLDDVPESVYSYDHFNKTRHWTQKHDFSDLPEKDRLQAKYALTRVYRESILREPLELITYIVRNDRPFTELVTADYIMVSPYTARGYGIFDDVRDQFQDDEDPFEYIPTRLPALTSRNGKVQKSETGFYPHAGLLSTFHYVRRYPTTDTNRNRLRARMYYQHFLGIDIMQLAPRVTDAAAVDAEYEIPTMQAADCVVCHKTVDPVAGLFQDYDKSGYFIPRREGWYKDMFGPGLEGEDLPDAHQWQAMQWLGERTAKDPRFATTMVEHVYYILTGRQVLQAPQDIDNPMFTPRRRAFLAQREMIESVAEEFVAGEFNLKAAFQAMIGTEFYRADGFHRVDGLEIAELQPRRRAELDDLGVVRLLTPEQLERKLLAVFGKQWGRLKKGDSRLDILYGGIDSKQITERIADPSGAMGAIQRIMANDIACKNVAADFAIEASQRRLFPGIEPSVLPEHGPDAQRQIRQAIVYLHQRLLGHEHAIDHPEVERTYQLFAGIIDEAKSQDGLSKQESYFCRVRENKPLDDPHYTLRAWRTVVTYLLRQHDFLYE